MICKRCHKRIIEVIKTKFELGNRYRCGSRRYGYVKRKKAKISGIDRGSKVSRKIHRIC